MTPIRLNDLEVSAVPCARVVGWTPAGRTGRRCVGIFDECGLMPALPTAVSAVTRAVVAVVLAVGIWVFVYAIAYEGAWGQFVLLVALPVVVLTVLLYEVSGRRRVAANSVQEQVARELARAVLALLVAAGTWAGVYKFAVGLSHDNLWKAAIVLAGPPIVALAVLLYLKLPRRRSG